MGRAKALQRSSDGQGHGHVEHGGRPAGLHGQGKAQAHVLTVMGAPRFLALSLPRGLAIGGEQCGAVQPVFFQPRQGPDIRAGHRGLMKVGEGHGRVGLLAFIGRRKLLKSSTFDRLAYA